MKKTLTVVFLFLTATFYSQESFVYNQQGLSPKFIVKKIDSLNTAQLYLKAIDWIKETYKNPDKVIKAKFENEKVRFSGAQSNYLMSKVLLTPILYDVRYTIEIAVKDGKYKFEPISFEYYLPASQYSSGGWASIPYSDGMWMYKKKGKKIRGMYKEFPASISAMLNSLELSLNGYLLKKNKTIKDKKDDW